jgi:hypothetical protein
MSFNVYGEFRSKPGEQKLLGTSDALTSADAIREAEEALGDLVINLEAVEVE